MTHTLTPDERHAVAGELRWLADQRDSGSVLTPDWLRQRADWIEVSGERRAPAREPDRRGGACRACDHDPHSERCEAQIYIPGDGVSTCDCDHRDGRADALDAIVLRWGEPR